jgi:TolB-like protein/class 3 adenylate cyclase/Flp pilus assembly protein TadD
MATQGFKRKLTAILSADVKGYSLLMRDDEEATVRTITTYREVVGSVVQKHRGELVDSPGDNILAEFASVVDALRSAVEVQEELKVRNAELPENRRMEFRIGINLGDVIHEKERIYGDGVNVAARVESLAEAGGICVSRSAYDQVKDKLTLGYEYFGEHSVKNIAEPVRVYRVLTKPENAGKVIGEKRVEPKRGQRVALAVVFVIVGAIAVTFWNMYFRPPPMEVASVEKMAFPLPDKPSIAVLPFTNISDDPKQEYFSDGITDDLITDLSKISGLFVIARNSSFTYKGKPVKVQQVAEDLGVRYVLEGSVRKAGAQVRINAQLIDATTGHHLWAERYDGNLDDIFVLQDRFTRKIVSALAVKLTAGEEESISHKYTDNVAAYEAYLQGLEHLRSMTREDLAKAVPFFEKAIELDPDFGQAYTQFAGVYQASLITAWYRELGWSNARSLRDKYLKLAMKNPTGETHGMVALKYIYKRQHEEAVAEAERAVALDPNSSQINHIMGQSLLFAGRSAEAVDFITRAMRLDPHYPVIRLHYLGLAQFCLGQFQEALTTLESAHVRKPKFGEWPLWATYAHLGREQEAADLMTEYMKRRRMHKRRGTAEKLLKYYPFKDPKDEERFADGVIKAGYPRPWNPVYRGQYEEAMSKAEQALAENPGDAEAQFIMGETLLFVGRPAEAVDFIKKAIQLNPKYPPFYLWYLGLAHFCLEQFEEAATSLEKCYKGYPGESRWLLAATYAQLGRQQEAAEVLRKYMKSRGLEHFTVEKVLKYDGFHAFKDPKDTERLAEGLHKAGLK